MPVQIRIPTPLRRHTGEQALVEVPPGTVGEAFDVLFERRGGEHQHILALLELGLVAGPRGRALLRMRHDESSEGSRSLP